MSKSSTDRQTHVGPSQQKNQSLIETDAQKQAVPFYKNALLNLASDEEPRGNTYEALLTRVTTLDEQNFQQNFMEMTSAYKVWCDEAERRDVRRHDFNQSTIKISSKISLTQTQD